MQRNYRFRPRFAPQIGAAWTPLSLGASLLAWWTADRTDLITLSGNQITSWKDSGYAIDAVQVVGASRPLYSATSFNGSPGATFDGVDDEMTAASGIAGWPTTTASETWGLALAADTISCVLTAYGANTSNSARRLQRTAITGTNRAQAIHNAVTVTDTAVDFSGRHVARAQYNATIDITVDNGTPIVGGAVTLAGGVFRTRLGASALVSASLFWRGVIRDVVYTLPLSSDQASLMWTYLMSRRNP